MALTTFNALVSLVTRQSHIHRLNKHEIGDAKVSAIPAVLTTIVATQSDKTGTGIYSAATITSLSTITAPVTATLTPTGSQPGNTNGPVPVVVYPGGLAWILNKFEGDPALIPALPS